MWLYFVGRTGRVRRVGRVGRVGRVVLKPPLEAVSNQGLIFTHHLPPITHHQYLNFWS
jgi:hypothetical protein